VRRSISLVLGATVAASLLAGCAAVAAPFDLSAREVTCSLPAGSPSIELTDTLPTPTLLLHLGDRFVVTVPPWSSTHATNVNVGQPGIAAQQCTVLLSNGGRRSVFTAQRIGTTWLGASVAPASGLFMPAWGASVTIRR